MTNMLEEVNSIVRDHISEQQLPLDEISSALSDDKIFQLCDPQFLRETLEDSEATSCSKFFQDDVNASKLSLAKDDHTDIYSAGTTATTTASSTTTTTTGNPSMIFDPGQEEIEKDISASIDFSPSHPLSIPSIFSTQQQDHLDFPSTVPPQVPSTNFITGGSSTHDYQSCDPVASLVGPTFLPVFEDEYLSSMPPTSFMPLCPTSASSSSFLSPGIVGTAYMPGNLNLMGSLLFNNQVQTQELDYQGGNGGIYCPDSVPNIFKPNSIKAFCNETQKLVNGSASGSAPLAAEISSLEDSTFKVGKLSVEQRKEKIHRYIKKRNERNFSKKIKYACRKTLADSRPRVRGRFAKNDDLGESHCRLACSSHDGDNKDEVEVKEEDDMTESSDIFAHISGLNSFKCNYSIQSWI